MPRIKKRKRIFDPRVWPTWLLLGLVWLLVRLPLSVLYRLGHLLGAIVYRFGRSRRHITDVNLSLCFPDQDTATRDALSRASFHHTALGALETMMVWLNPRRDVCAATTLHGVEHLREAVAQGRGVVLLGGHFTAMDIIASALKPLDIDVIYRENKNPLWEWLQVSGRRRFFDGVIERENTREILRRLKSGRAIWYAADQDYGRKHSVFAPFFGVQAATINATARLARFNQSPVVFMSHFRNLETRTWSVHFHPRLENFPTGDDVGDATRINGILEDAIRQHPEQYLWMHRRFKTRPEGEPGLY
ncbi:MAG: LpxL/LpxP family Kdo(2)-lipid IV(A) lauroyl/palmitoleoyl acyltransferase [Pseudomonadales bacterium]|nr:LpxL/LpxP family Kdo(2)-lipid IV(A) lauroyl/palmitoleoyl acyltransferase [Pseudomonadales bacterium]